MKLKVSFVDRTLLKHYLTYLSYVSVLVSIVLIAIEIPIGLKLEVTLLLIVLIFLGYIIMWIKVNLSNSARIKINNSIVNVKIGDIFKEEGLKVIPFNEYFDTKVDNKIISELTLNGKYINQFIKNVSDLDQRISQNQRLSEKVIDNNSFRRYGGKKCRYKLGSLFINEDYLLTAFSRFDKDNKAYLYMNDYINFLLNLWNEVDIIYAGRTVTIPLIGSGMTRLKGYEMASEQELLELIIWSFKVSKIKFKHPHHVKIVIHESDQDKINFYRLRSVSNGL